MGQRRCVYTVLFGGYEPLHPQHTSTADIDLICFTDDPTLTSQCWQIRPLPPLLPGDPTRNARRVKLLAHDYLPEYGTSLYVDNTVELLVDPQVLFDLLPADQAMAVPLHSYRATVSDEFAAVVTETREARWVCAEQQTAYLSADPGSLELQPLWSGLMVRRHHEPEVVAGMRLWWDHVQRYSRRDQLSLRYVQRQSGLGIHELDLDNLRSPVHRWPRLEGRDPSRGTPLAPGPHELIDQLSADVVHLRAQAQQLRDQLAAAQRNVEELSVALDAEHSRVLELLDSTSWRVTGPLRAVSQTFRSRGSG